MSDPVFSLSSLIEVLQLRVETERDTPAYYFWHDDGARDVLTNGRLEQRARAIAGYLLDEELTDQPVVLLYPPGLDFIQAFFGCLLAGAVAVPTHPPRPKRPLTRLRAIISNCGARAALTCSEFESHVTEWKAAGPDLANLDWISTDRLADPTDGERDFPLATPEDPALLQYTSGSTGEPKGVVITHRNLMHNLGMIHTGFDIQRVGMGISWLPVYHDMGLIGGILQPIFAGGPLTLLSPISFLRRPLRWLQAIDRFGGTISGGPNFAYEMCVERITPEQRDQLDLSRWRTAYCGAEPIRWQTLERFSEYFAPCGFRMEAFYPCFGMAESTLMVSGGEANSLPRVLCVDKRELQNHRVIVAEGASNGCAVQLVGCGSGFLGQEVAIVDPQSCTLLGERQVGEIWVHGPSVARGYWNRAELTDKTFHGRLANGDPRSFLRTADLGFLHDGQLYVTGRLKDLIIIRGRNHYPQDIEQTVEACHASLRPMGCAAFGVQVDDSEQLVVVQEIQRGVRRAECPALLDAIREVIIREHEIQPQVIVLVKTLSVPKTSSGKVQRRETRQQFLDGELSELSRWCAGSEQSESLPSAARPQSTNASPGESPSSKHGVGLRPEQETEDCSVRTESRPAKALESPPSKTGSEKAPPSVTAAEIEHWLVQTIAARVGRPADQVETRRPFEALGLDSLTAVRVMGDLEAWLDRSLSPALVYEFSDIATLAAHLANGKVETAAADPAVQQRFAEPLAIVGMACRFPGGASDPESFWQLLAGGVDAVSEVPADRWDSDSLYDPDPDAPGKMSTRWGGFLDGVDRFDPQFFNIAPREARTMDPQQRLLLEVAWEALENAGLSPARLAGTPTGVFTGICNNDYARLLQTGATRSEIDAYYGTGCAFSVSAGRLSYVLGLQGPSLPIDTACSSSLVAVHLACQSLLRDECQTALAGGVNLMLSPDATIYFSKVRAMAADGRCKAFDQAADGYVRGEGCGIVVLKRLSRAVRDGDRVLALIRGTAINHDGASNGLTAPNPASQERVIRQALAAAGIEPAEVGYLEAHGTGTALGDPVEARALGGVFSSSRGERAKLRLGSVKTNIGHLEAAAGVAGLIKTVLAMEHQAIPPHLHFQQPNPQIALDTLPLSIPTRLESWPSAGRRRVAGVSSFGFSGTNAHVILEEAPRWARAVSQVERPVHVFTLSARTESARERLLQTYIDHLQQNEHLSLANICHTAGAGRSHFEHRLAVAAASVPELTARLSALADGRRVAGGQQGQAAPRRPSIAFTFPDLGCCRPGIAQELYETQPVFRERIQQISERSGHRGVLELLTANSGRRESVRSDAGSWPAAVALQYALAELWRGWGVEPCVVSGSGPGEFAAAAVAGWLPPEQAMRLAACAERATKEDTNRNSVAEALADVTAVLSTSGSNESAEPGIQVTCWRTGDTLDRQCLRTADAWMQRLSGPALTETANATQPAADTASSQRHDCSFVIAMRPAEGAGDSPDRNDRAGGPVRLASLAFDGNDWDVLLDSLARLYVSGTEIDWSGFDRGYVRHRVALPTYPFDRKRYWFEPAARRAVDAVPVASSTGGNGKHDHGRHSSSASVDSLPQQIRSARAAHRASLISDYLKRELAAELDVAETAVELDRPLAEMGLDSLMIMGVISSIKDDFKIHVYPREVYEQPTIAALAEYLSDQWDRFADNTSADSGNGNAKVTGGKGLHAYRVHGRPRLSGERVANTAFILSAPRSGSTLLRVMLAGHTAVFAPPELHLLPFDEMRQRAQLLAETYLGEGLTRALMEARGIDLHEARAQTEAWIQQCVPVDQIYRELAHAVHPRLLVDKSPTYAGRREVLERAEAWFEQPKYIFLARHPLAVIESLVRMRLDKLVGHSVDNPYRWAEDVWRDAARNVTAFFEDIPHDRRLTLRYESLVTQPEAEMERLAAFLQIPYDDALLEPYTAGRMTDAADDRAAPIDDPNFLARNRIDPALADAWRNVRLPHPVGKATEQLAEQLGYRMTSVANTVPASERARSASPPATGDDDDHADNGRKRRPSGNGSRTKGVLRETFLDANGLRLCVCSWGPADGPVVLCLHGILDQGTCWELVARQLARRGYRVVAPDLRGHGRSEHVGAGCAYHFPDFVADADAVLRTLGPEPILLAGHSLGAVVATHLALARPERFTSLTAIEPPLRRESASPEQQRLSAYLDYAAAPPEHKPFADLRAAADRLQRAVPALSARLALRLARRSSEQTPEGRLWRWDAKLRTRSGLAYAANQLTRAAFQSAIAEIPLPVTVVQGSEGMTRWDVLPHDDASRVACVTIDGGHHLTIETPKQVAAAITNAMRVVGGVL